jgi:hypothetical protein
MLQAVLLKTDALYRSEVGGGTSGRRMLSPDELARAVSLAFGNRRDAALVAAAEKGQLTTPEQVAAHVRRILDDRRRKRPGCWGSSASISSTTRPRGCSRTSRPTSSTARTCW